MTVQPLTPAEWRELQLAPLWVLSAIGTADGKLDKAEKATLVEGVAGCAAHTDEFVSSVFAAVSKDFDSLWDGYQEDERFAIHALRTIGDLLARAVDPVQALHFKQTLVQLGVDVADASGGMLGLGTKRSRVEREALQKVAEALRMPSRRLMVASQSSFDSILVPLDGSPESEAAISIARTLASQFGSQVTLLDVVQESRPSAAVAAEGFVAPVPLPSTAELQSAAASYLQGVRSTYGAPEWKAIVAVGPPADTIVGQARQAGADLIVMATSGSAGMKRLFEGKVTEDVLRKSSVPVLVVPLEEDEF